jgi:hypothetical protein
MSERAAALAAELERQAGKFERLVESLTEDQLRLEGVNTPDNRFLDEDEHRPVNVIAYHVASFLPRHLASTRARVAGQPPPAVNPGEINAEEARERVDVTPAETLERLRAEVPPAADFIRGLSDEQLDRTFTTPMGEFTIEKGLSMILIGHIGMHRKSIEATIEGR